MTDLTVISDPISPATDHSLMADDLPNTLCDAKSICSKCIIPSSPACSAVGMDTL